MANGSRRPPSIRSPLANALSTHTTPLNAHKEARGRQSPPRWFSAKNAPYSAAVRACRPRGQTGVSRGRARAAVGPLATNPPDARVVLRPEIALRGLAATSPDLGVEGATTPLTHRRATLGPNAGVKLFTVLLARRRAATPRGLRARPRARLAAVGSQSHQLAGALLASACQPYPSSPSRSAAPRRRSHARPMRGATYAQVMHSGTMSRPCPRVPPEA